MGKKTINELGTLQRAVMEIVWRLGDAKVGDVHEQLARQRKQRLAYTTVLSAMQKLEKAGWLTHHTEGRAHVYQAARSREEEGRTSIRSLLNQVFSGDPMVMFQHLLSDDRLSADDLSALRKMIDKRRKDLKE